MRHLGIDYGTKRVGIALSDEMGHMAFPHSVIVNDVKLQDTIEKIVHENKVGAIVIGHSVNNQGVANNVHAAVEALVLNLTLALGLPIHLEPEWYTTQEAMRFQGKNALKDASAAAIILDSFLRKQK